MKSVERPDAVISGDVYRVLLQIALLGAELGDAQTTVQIADALGQARPDLPQACAVRAMGYLNLGQRDEAVRGLESALERFPDFQLGKALLGVCMHIAGRTGWQHYLDSVIDDGRDDFAVGMACEILGRPRDQAAASIEDAPKPDTNSNPTGYAVWA